MHNPLVIEAIMLIAAIIVGVWSQRALPLHADSRPILFLLCLFLGTGSALCLLLDILALLLTGQVATGGVRIYGPLLLLVLMLPAAQHSLSPSPRCCCCRHLLMQPQPCCRWELPPFAGTAAGPPCPRPSESCSCRPQ